MVSVVCSLTENKNTMKANFNTIEELTPLSEEDCFILQIGIKQVLLILFILM